MMMHTQILDRVPRRMVVQWRGGWAVAREIAIARFEVASALLLATRFWSAR
jgi:hypothetical protein